MIYALLGIVIGVEMVLIYALACHARDLRREATDWRTAAESWQATAIAWEAVSTTTTMPSSHAVTSASSAWSGKKAH